MNGSEGTTVIRREHAFLAGWLALSLLPVCCSPARFDAKSAVEKLFKAWELRDELTLQDLLADGVRWEIVGEPYARLSAPDGSRILSPEAGKTYVARATEWRSATGRR